MLIDLYWLILKGVLMARFTFHLCILDLIQLIHVLLKGKFVGFLTATTQIFLFFLDRFQAVVVNSRDET